MVPIITNMGDDDKYKFTMQHFVFHRYPEVEVEVEFKLRNEGIDLSPYVDQILEQLCSLERLRLKPEEKIFFKNQGIFSDTYLDFLEHYRFNPQEISVTRNPFGLKFKGKWVNVILWEVKALAIINQVYFDNVYPMTTARMAEGDRRLKAKISYIRSLEDFGFKFIDFGTRRRRSAAWQLDVVSTLAQMIPNNFVGTSNMNLARLLNIPAVGTMAHEYLQAFQVLAPLYKFQKQALQEWADFYKGNLLIALTDVVGMDAFLRDFDGNLSRLYDGGRQDSGDPYEWGYKLINHYKSFGINPLAKQALWSDSLNIPKAYNIYKEFHEQIQVLPFGIGTDITNDFEEPALNIVIKMTSCQGLPVAKISDSKGKGMCKDEHYLHHLAKTYNIEL